MTSNNNGNRSTSQAAKIYDLPYDKRTRLCSILDMNDCWKELGGRYLKLNRADLDTVGKAILRRESPTDDLLVRMECQNRTVHCLFSWLYQMEHFQAMDVIKSFVDSKFHHLIPEGTGLNSDVFARRRSDIANATVVDQCNKENVKQNKVLSANADTKHRSERTTQRKLSEGSDIEKLDPSIPFIPFEELEESTNGWHHTRKLGRGGFGVVYKGYWRQTFIAIKRLEPPKRNEAESNVPEVQKQQSLKELKHLNISRHDNILPLYGYSIHGHKYVLVYQYMPNGSLDDRLHRTNAEYLPWSLKHKIAKGTARGLQFLHGMDPPLVHGDIKSANILLDQYFDAKIGDFGLAREGPTNQSTHVNISRVYGTRPYLPHEFLRHRKFSKKVDVFSFGVVLFEIATGKKPFEDSRSEKFLRDYVYTYEECLTNLMDTRGKHENHLYLNLYKLFIDVGKLCVDDVAKQRPEMIDVFRALDINASPNPSFVRRPSLIPPSYATIPPTSISPVGSRDPRRSPSPNFVTNQTPAWNLTPAPSITNQPAKSLTPVFSPPQIRGTTEVSCGEKISSMGSVAPVIPVAVEQNPPKIPNIILIPPNESCVDMSNVHSASGISSSESERSTQYTDTSDGNVVPETRSGDETENKESVSEPYIPAVTALQRSSEESNEPA